MEEAKSASGADASGFVSPFAGMTIFDAFVNATRKYGPNTVAVDDALGTTLTYRRMMIGARVLAKHIARLTEPGEPVAVLLPNASAVCVTFLALQSIGRVPAMLNYSAGHSTVVSACKTVEAKTVLASRAFVEKAELHKTISALEEAGLNLVWLEDLRKQITLFDKAAGFLGAMKAIEKSAPDDRAVILFTSGSEGLPKAVVLSHDNILTNCAQSQARVAFSPADKLFNVLPVFHSFGLTGGMILPLVSGVSLYLYPSPLHYKIIPQAVRKTGASILFGTDTFLTGYARMAKDEDFSSVRMVVAGAEAVKPETKRIWAERFSATVLEGFGMTEAAPVVAVNTIEENKQGSVGKLLPGMEFRLEPVEGIENGGKLWVKGPNVMMGYMTAEKPGVLQPLKDGWHDSGDIVNIDADGYVTIKGRVKRFAKIAGEMVSLGAVEMLVSQLWPEENHAVVSVPDKKRGEKVVLITTAQEVQREILIKATQENGLTELMVPATVFTVNEVPVLGSGKTDYQGARTLVIKELGLDRAA